MFGTVGTLVSSAVSDSTETCGSLALRLLCATLARSRCCAALAVPLWFNGIFRSESAGRGRLADRLRCRAPPRAPDRQAAAGGLFGALVRAVPRYGAHDLPRPRGPATARTVR